jgi:hypothetical protein
MYHRLDSVGVSPIKLTPPVWFMVVGGIACRINVSQDVEHLKGNNKSMCRDEICRDAFVKTR